MSVGVPIDKSTRAAILACIGLTLITFAAFWPVLQNDFINYDDTAYVTENAHVLSGLSWDNLTWAFRTGYFANWHPLTWVSHMLDVELFGLNPHGHHFTSLFFHVANTMVLFLLLRGMSGQEWPSAFVAALFALHPLHVESVAWVSERKDVLSAFFGLLTLWAYGKSKGSRVLSPESRVEKGSRVQSSEFGVLSRGSQVEGEEPTRGASRVTHHVSRFFYFLALFFFALALMCKAMLVTLPFVMLLLDFWPLRRLRCRCVPSGILDEPQKTAESKPENPNGPARSIWPFVLEKIPFFALSAASTILGFYLLKGEGAISDSPEIGLGDRVAHSLIACEAYLGKLLWPAALALPYPRAAQWSYWQVILGVALVVGLSLLALSSAARRPYVTVGWLWFLGMLTPVIGIVPLGAHAFADRYTYLPLIGLFIAGVWAATEAASARTIRTALAASGIILLTALATITHRQLGYWRNSEQLYLHTLAVTRDNFIAHNGLGLVFFNQGKIEEAILQYESAVALNPAYDTAHSNLGRALAEKGKYEPAIAHFEAALRLRPDDTKTHNNLGNVLALQGRHEEAIKHFTIVARLTPAHAGAHNNLAISYKKLGRTAEAISEYREAIRINPGFLEALNNLAWMLATEPDAQFRNGSEAVQLATKACELTQYQHPIALATLAAAFAEIGKFSEANSFLDRAQERAPAKGSPLGARLQAMHEAFQAGRAYHE